MMQLKGKTQKLKKKTPGFFRFDLCVRRLLGRFLATFVTSASISRNKFLDLGDVLLFLPIWRTGGVLINLPNWRERKGTPILVINM